MEINRKNKLLIGLVTVAAVLVGKLFYIQCINGEYKVNADNNSMVYDYIYPPRGVIYDRNGEILVGNKVCYDILVTPKEVEESRSLILWHLQTPCAFPTRSCGARWSTTEKTASR